MWSASVQAPSSAGGGRDDSPLGWNSDEERDYEDQQYSPPSPVAYYPGSRNPLARFMADLPKLDDFDKLSLDEALRRLPVPDSCPAPPGISLQDAIKVQHISSRCEQTVSIQYRITTSYTISYMMSYVYIITRSYAISYTI